MGGDVFGNGMLLSRHIRLVGAFNHMHVFIDPDPDPEATFAERERLFALPRSTWDDFDRSGDVRWRRDLAAEREVDRAESPRPAPRSPSSRSPSPPAS